DRPRPREAAASRRPLATGRPADPPPWADVQRLPPHGCCCWEAARPPGAQAQDPEAASSRCRTASRRRVAAGPALAGTRATTAGGAGLSAAEVSTRARGHSAQARAPRRASRRSRSSGRSSRRPRGQATPTWTTTGAPGLPLMPRRPRTRWQPEQILGRPPDAWDTWPACAAPGTPGAAARGPRRGSGQSTGACGRRSHEPNGSEHLRAQKRVSFAILFLPGFCGPKPPICSTCSEGRRRFSRQPEYYMLPILCTSACFPLGY
ncbi:unnamed protein product, partial [Prorocentrum cordatum]